MKKAFIIDDEQVAINVLTMMIERHVPGIASVESTTSPMEAIEKIKVFRPDILFLDIEMPNLNGFELLKSLQDISFEVVFTTAFDKYAIQAIKFSALDYLLKPIDAEELKETFNRFIEKSQVQASQDITIKNLLANLQQQDTKKHKLALPSTDGTQFFLPQDIIRCEGMSNYTKFYFCNHRPIITSKTIKEYEEILTGHHFLRIHKSHLVNIDFVEGYVAQKGTVRMKDGSEVEISRRRKPEVMQALGLKD